MYICNELSTEPNTTAKSFKQYYQVQTYLMLYIYTYIYIYMSHSNYIAPNCYWISEKCLSWTVQVLIYDSTLRNKVHYFFVLYHTWRVSFWPVSSSMVEKLDVRSPSMYISELSNTRINIFA